MSESRQRPSIGFTWNIPNLLTILRLILVPVFLVIFLWAPDKQSHRIWATVVFLAAIATDFLDGKIARKYNLITNFGKLWDSIADKALTGAAFIALSMVGELPWWMTIIILLREWGITAMRFGILKYGVMSANRGGKLKTFVQSAAIIAFLLGLPALGKAWVIFKWVLMIIAFALTVITGVDYLVEAWKLRKASIAAGKPVDISKVRDEQ